MAEPYVLFEVAGATYAVRSAHVQQMEMVERITSVPNAAAFVEGIVYLRGQVMPVVNLRARFGFEKIPYDMRARLIVVNLEGRQVALAVDAAREFVPLAPEQIAPPPDAIVGASTAYIAGVVSLDERLVLVLDLQRVLTVEDRAALATAAVRQGAPKEGGAHADQS